MNGVEQLMDGWRFFDEDEIRSYDCKDHKNPYGQWQEEQAQRRKARRANREKNAENV